MKGAITLLTILLLLHPGINGQKDKLPAPSTIKWVVEPPSNLNINGKSNVNTFQCGITEFLHADTLVYTPNEGGHKPATLKGSVCIDIKRFDCKHKFITADLRKTLKADVNPNLIIRFLSMDKLIPGTNNQAVKGIVEIELAGVRRPYEVSYTVQNGSNSQLLELTGKRLVQFSDFGLKPPTRLAGLIKVAEEIEVEFQLYLKAVPAAS